MLLSLQAQDSTGTSASAVSQDSTNALSDTVGNPMSRHDSSASHASSLEHRPSWPVVPGSTASSSQLTGKRRRSLVPSSDAVDGRQFLSLLFDRQDYLLAISSEDEDETNADTNANEFDKTLDPRLFLEGRILPVGSPMETSLSRKPSPEKAEKPERPERGETVRSIHATHLRSRQPIVNTIRVHPNLNLRNLFGNLPFSSSVRANNYPEDVQNTQVNNLFLPTWAMMTVSTRPDPGTIKLAFSTILQEAALMLDTGTPIESVIEIHPNIAALFDEDVFNNAGALSRWAAGMVHSVMLKGMSHPLLLCWLCGPRSILTRVGLMVPQETISPVSHTCMSSGISCAG